MAGFIKAVRSQRKLRAAFDGPAGAGKTFTSLRLAFALVAAGLAKRVGVIDSEANSASLYAGEAPDGKPWDFDVLELKKFGPDEYTAAINLGVKSGFDVLVVDSLSHAWVGAGGALELKDQKGGNSFAAWKDITPMQRRMVDTIIGCNAHVVATMRSKVEYVLEEDEKGKKVPRKIGMAPVQRDGLEYEFDIYGSVDDSSQLKVTKTRCAILHKATTVKAGPTFWAPLFDWLQSAEPSAPRDVSEAEFVPTKPAAPTEAKPTVASLTSLILATATEAELEATRPALREAMEKKHISRHDGTALKVKFDEHAARLKANAADPIPY